MEVGGIPDMQMMERALMSLPSGPAHWIIDDLLAPALLLRDLLGVPEGAEAREGFLGWRYGQHLGLSGTHYLQSLKVDETSWLLLGMPQQQRADWLMLAEKLGRPIRAMTPRWLWLYNRIAASQAIPGMLLSLHDTGGNRYSGTLAVWGQILTLLRQWQEPLSVEAWLEERIHPSLAFLHREGRSCQELLVWGAPDWPPMAIPVRLLSWPIPTVEVG